ncbi:MAG: hypothetical protein IKE22_14215 [Atopobiaceae bacterium]|nr:hypothetical protein [Atopobiaceae bacterium]
MAKGKSGERVPYKKPEVLDIPPEGVRIRSQCRGLVSRYWEWVEEGRPTRKPVAKPA